MGGAGKKRLKRVGILFTVIVLLTGAAGAAWWTWEWSSSRLVREGQAAYERGDLPLTVIKAREALKERRKDPEALRLLARASARLGETAFARDIFTSLPPKLLNAEDHYLLGKGLIQENRQSDALLVLKRAHALDPKHPETLNELADLDTGFDHLSEASDLAEQLSQLKGWETRGSVMLGLLRGQLLDPAGAARAFRHAFDLDPSLKNVASPVAIGKDYARALLSIGKPMEARKALRTVLEQKADPEASWLLCRAELQCGDSAAAEQARNAAGTYGQDRPETPEPALYLGSSRCAECHEDIHRLSRGSRHAKTYRPGSEMAEFPLPKQPVVDRSNPKIQSTLIKEPDGVHMEVRDEGKIRRALIEFAVGSGDRGLTPVGRDEAGRLRELRLSYYGDIDGWDRTTGHPLTPPDHEGYLGVALGPDEERHCLDCHTTNYRAAMEQTGPAASDRGIGCERCHGPAGNHVLAIAAKFPDPMIARPRLAAPESVVNLCGQCHRPPRGQVDPTKPDSTRFQAATLTWSRCYKETGKSLSCATCHNPHHDADTSPSAYEPKCLACHSQEPSPAPPASSHPSRQTAALPDGVRRVSCPVNPKTNCLECHMPTVRTTMLHTIFTDHYIRVHRDEKSPAHAAE